MSKTTEITNKIKDIPVTDKDAKTILVVEDDRTHRTLMQKILKECEFLTVPAENGLVALAKIDSGQTFDLILMDWDMPELDGLETVKKIRERQTQGDIPHIPVIAFTSHRDPGDREKCIAAGMDAYLPKDVWMPKWRATLIDNLQGLLAGDFNPHDFEGAPQSKDQGKKPQGKTFDLDAFDMQTLEQSAALLKDELAIAVDEYLEDAAAYIRDIREGFEEGNAEKVARGSHPLKSNSKGFGLTAVSQISEAINKLARDENLTAARPLQDQLLEAFHRAEKKLRETIKCAGY